MIVIIEDAVFADPPSAGGLVNVVSHGLDGRHRILVDPLYREGGSGAVNEWLTSHEKLLRKELELALAAGIEEAVQGVPSDHTVRIALVDSSDWNSTPPRLTLAEAENFLREPLRLILEDYQNDRSFLEAVAPEDWRSHLREVIAKGFLEPVHGGGLSGVRRRVENGTTTSGDHLRHWVLFDSDALQPGEPSKDSEAVRMACEARDVPHHQLERRASENYLPLQALHAWANLTTRASAQQRRERCEAFSDMEPVQRHHYNMKAGFQRDQQRGIPGFFGRHAKNPVLQSGFGKDIGSLFQESEFQLLDEWFVRDGQRPETGRLIQSILRAL